ncbi:lipoprotein [Nocardiopsis terrae]|uniref:Uncharacterized protein (DUF305 family) n=1 Tax=Nocardiopsis terrae TaxID=372655 RepID=A0ABR9HCT6_9ACTN|nr:DUF305 domain-containing protein [Nocardiopsis terrae]MBE1456847.1 uncharacterized protein (DUF305 family) [Nocardiopsis terrae]GHC74811.1 lipoprotein [Nocardiopsis terrae]
MTSIEHAPNRRVLTAIAAAFATALFAAACGNDGGDAPNTTSDSEEQTAGFNEADVEFAQMMIPHHEQAVTMADLAGSRAGEEVRALSEEIRDAQGPEIEQMETLLDAWGAGTGDGTDHSGMAGMLSEEQMSELETAEGEDFDTLFLEYMVLHHEGAVDMARTELDEGVDPEALELAEEIIAAQESEIELMNEMLGAGEPGADPASETPEAGESDGGTAEDGHSEH